MRGSNVSCILVSKLVVKRFKFKELEIDRGQAFQSSPTWGTLCSLILLKKAAIPLQLSPDRVRFVRNKGSHTASNPKPFTVCYFCRQLGSDDEKARKSWHDALVVQLSNQCHSRSENFPCLYANELVKGLADLHDYLTITWVRSS